MSALLMHPDVTTHPQGTDHSHVGAAFALEHHLATLFGSFDKYFGMSLAVCGNVLISISFIAQKHAHNQNDRKGNYAVPYTQLRLWWVGMVLMALGEMGNFSAYAFAPATLVSPLGAVSVMCNAVGASVCLGEVLVLRDYLGCLLCVAGGSLIVLFSPNDEHQLTVQQLEHEMHEPFFLIFMAVILVLIFILLILTHQTDLSKDYLGIDILICSLLGCITVMCCKAISTFLVLTISGKNQFTDEIAWGIVATIVLTTILQIRYFNRSLRNFDANRVMPVYYVLFTVCSCFGGVVLYKEFHNNHWGSIVAFVVGCCLIFCGITLITSKRFPAEEFDLEMDEEEETLHLISDEQLLAESSRSPSSNSPFRY